MTRPHALISGSFAHIFLKCPGAIVLRESLPPKPASSDMLDGNKAHELAEIALADLLSHKLEGTDPNIRAHLLAPYPEMEEAARDYAQAVLEEALEGRATSKPYVIEDKLTIDERLGMYGYADFWACYLDDRAKRVGVIGDFKYGFRHVEVDKNPQLAFYAVALREELRKENIELDYIRAFIYQPRAKSAKPYRETKFTSSNLDTWKKKFLKVAEDVIVKKKYKFKAGSHCKLCPCQEVCPTYAKSLSNETTIALINPAELTFPEPEKISDKVLSNIILHADALDTFIKACKRHVLGRCLNGNPVPGVKVVEGSTKRKIDGERETEIGEFFNAHGIDPFTKKLKGITALGNELKAKGLSKNLVDSFCTKGQPPAILVPDSDPRPAVKQALDYLGDLEDAESD